MPKSLKASDELRGSGRRLRAMAGQTLFRLWSLTFFWHLKLIIQYFLLTAPFIGQMKATSQSVDLLLFLSYEKKSPISRSHSSKPFKLLKAQAAYPGMGKSPNNVHFLEVICYKLIIREKP
jgi:hypothetical protein